MIKEEIDGRGNVRAIIDGFEIVVCDEGGWKSCSVTSAVGGVVADFSSVEVHGMIESGNTAGFEIVSDATIARMRRWAERHGIRPEHPARTPSYA